MRHEPSLTVPVEAARSACAESITGFVAATDSFDDLALFESSRCLGWTRFDVAVHVSYGIQEMLGGFACPAERAPTVDAATYWPAFADDSSNEDPVTVLMSQRRRTDAFAGPHAARRHLHELAAIAQHAVRAADDRGYQWQGHTFTTGDFLAVWAVEIVIHHLDLLSPTPAPHGALQWARRTIDALLPAPLPATWQDQRAVLVGTGREAASDDVADPGDLPVLR